MYHRVTFSKMLKERKAMFYTMHFIYGNMVSQNVEGVLIMCVCTSNIDNSCKLSWYQEV